MHGQVLKDLTGALSVVKCFIYLCNGEGGGGAKSSLITHNIWLLQYISTPRQIVSLVQGLGFEEDKGASCCMASAGTYKYQHNTDTDLKTVHVSHRHHGHGRGQHLLPHHPCLVEHGTTTPNTHCPRVLPGCASYTATERAGALPG